ncbi:MAG: 50S ribosomal protein L3 [Omnitrophica bacterium RIFCSPLOWO2_02_FULL_45_16]|nr:MAG: 50S ribosomal protein L3 [Omnitrophica bacterium RIFCSPHIGHO2_02_FULL_46_20]OGW92549.1 MAG: 50S ribosomal protein L3 [Omnitrophica bacterium RIFCSPLOWO2_12_FULL_45_13]OGW93163.1 MAG: 50S ribosomal protein L3 [Omnitrophica bacterium RIFCSPLOWO2_01_FULL_45_24]OGX00130.1 MAG: 50S ribosomal protein L3 [Omnitrophica bacterium RIFCSPLOWO2_02_FULL_45_16]
MVGILGKKIGMTHIFDENGRSLPVTLIEAGPCYVVQIKTKETDGYTAVQVGFDERKPRLIKKVEAGRFKKAGVNALRFVKELRLDDVSTYKVGQRIEADLFAKGDFVDVVGTSIGKGFQGGMKRWNWKGGPGGHGSMFHRAVGSIQSGARLGRVTKGHHLPGHMGVDRVTIQNLEILKADKENNLLVVKGAVPGHKNSYLMVKESKKMPKGYVKHKVVAQTPKKGSKGPGQAAPKKK